MKKIALSLGVVGVLLSCDALKNVNKSQALSTAALLGSLSSNSTVQQISTLFTALDSNKDKSISKTEAIGSVAENFNVLDTDKSSGLNITELTGLLGLLKK